MALRFPQADSVAAYWDNLRNGRDCISRFSDDELRRAGIDEALLRDPSYVKALGFIDKADEFDANLFDINPNEALTLDFQQRVFLECVWEALESAGCDPDRYEGRIGAYSGVGMNTYGLLIAMQAPELMNRLGLYQVMINNDKDFLATRVAYKFNLKGPCMGIQTACSSSLVAVHVAAQSLISGECDLALAGGVSIRDCRKRGYQFREGAISSPDGYCRAFDAKANGTVSADGAGVVALKRLSDAIRDGDNVIAVIKGSAVNNDGAGKVGYTAPSVEGQSRVIREAMSVAGVEPDSIGYVEAHGTGTTLGDPIEVEALASAFRASSCRETQFCALGSAKSNMGHLDTAAGIAGFIKACLALANKEIPPTVNYDTPNPKIDFASSPFFVNTSLRPWPANGRARRASVSAFGIGGTNAHVVLEEANPRSAARDPEDAMAVVPLSGKTREALDALAGRLADYLCANPGVPMTDVAHTMQVGRRALPHRRVAVGSDATEVAAALRDSEKAVIGRVGSDASRISPVFMFSGQGAQRLGMGTGLYETEPVYRDSLDECLAIIDEAMGERARAARAAIAAPASVAAEGSEAALDATDVVQPALFAVEYALARLLMAWGIQPKSMIGHSVGEFVAACLAGVFSLPDALRLVILRGQAMQSMSPGAMIAVALSEADARPRLNGDLSLAAVNAPRLCALSGSEEAVRRLELELAREGTPGQRLSVSRAFHSPMMGEAADAFLAAAGRVALKAPTLEFISNLTGARITEAEATDPDYWRRHMLGTVRFLDGIRALSRSGRSVFLEVGPGNVLASLVQQCLAGETGVSSVAALPLANGGKEERRGLLTAVGRLWTLGVDLDWSGPSGSGRRRKLPLPTYPFQRKRFWITPEKQSLAPQASSMIRFMNTGNLPSHGGPDLAAAISNWFYAPKWKRAEARPDASPLAADGSWIVFEDEVGVGARFSQTLSERGVDPIRVAIGEEFSRLGGNRFALNPSRPEDYRALSEALASGSAQEINIAHFWTVGACVELQGAASAERSFDRGQQLGYGSFLHFMKATGAWMSSKRLRILAVSSGTADVSGAEPVDPSRSTLLGAMHVIPQENPGAQCRCIDVDAKDFADPGASVAFDALAAELLSRRSEHVVALRKGVRWVENFESVDMRLRREAGSRVKRGGTYLITGGLGNIGFVLAKFLAEEFGANLILTGRGALPAAADASGNGSGGRADRLAELTRLGSKALYLAADASDRARMAEVVDAAIAEFGKLDGVFHAAGNLGKGAFRMIDQITEEALASQFLPKAQGLWAIESAIRGKGVDFCLLFSSVSAMLGGLGYVAYAAANRYMDAYIVGANRRSETRWISVNWDVWTFSEKEASGAEGSLASFAITPSKGREAFRAALSLGQPQIIVSTGDLQKRLDSWINIGSEAPSPEGDANESQLHERPELSTEYSEPSGPTERKVAQVWESVLGIRNIGRHDNFFELGGTSLLGIQIVGIIKKEFGGSHSVATLFEGPTVASLARILAAEESEEEDLGFEDRSKARRDRRARRKAATQS